MKKSDFEFLDQCKKELLSKLLKSGLPEDYIKRVMVDKENHVFEYLSNLNKHNWDMTLFIKLEVRRIMTI